MSDPFETVEQLNAAKGRLRTILYHGLFVPNEKLLRAYCNCKERTLFGYEKTLYDLKVPPSDTNVQKRPILDMLRSLDKFQYKASGAYCRGPCSQNFNNQVKVTVARVREYFQGLCLDCMNHTNPKTGDTDMDYWRHGDLSPDEWSRGCRLSHGEPTWYFSYMGRREDRDRFMRRERS